MEKVKRHKKVARNVENVLENLCFLPYNLGIVAWRFSLGMRKKRKRFSFSCTGIVFQPSPYPLWLHLRALLDFLRVFLQLLFTHFLPKGLFQLFAGNFHPCSQLMNFFSHTFIMALVSQERNFLSRGEWLFVIFLLWRYKYTLRKKYITTYILKEAKAAAASELFVSNSQDGKIMWNSGKLNYY